MFEVVRARVAAAGMRRLLHIAFLFVAIATAVPVGGSTLDRLTKGQQEAKERFIRLHRLWELHPEYKGTPETWTRFASRLLSDRQIMFRVQAKYGSGAEEIELDYRRDLAIAQAEILLKAIAVWMLPLVLLYLGGWILYRRRRTPAAPKPAPASVNDPRYMPAQPAEKNHGGNS